MANRLEEMRDNPNGDWTIGDVEALCKECGIECSAPRSGGSHWKVSDPTQREILTIPRRRTLKPVYIRKLVQFVDRVNEARDDKA
jgi:hypothetical protein